VSVRLSRRRLSLGAAERALEPGNSGGVVVFAGRVRPDRRNGATVVALEYEVDRVPAIRALQALEREARHRFGARDVVLWHRLGRVASGEISVVVGAACGHRVEAFAAARFLIDRLKSTVPLWKEERARSARRPRRPRARPAGRSAG
jgi:molybdopterin synthase catalytic subunit